jgi:hypothetical protein
MRKAGKQGSKYYEDTVITLKSVYQLYLVKGLFRSRLCVFFPANISPEAEGKISTSVSLMPFYPHISEKISVFACIWRGESLFNFQTAQKISTPGQIIKRKEIHAYRI